MSKIKIKKGLNIPIKGSSSGEVHVFEQSNFIALDVSKFEFVKFQLLKKVGETVRIGEALLCDKSFPKRVFVSPAAGIIASIQRGDKRRILSVVIEKAKEEAQIDVDKIDIDNISREDLIAFLLKTGLFTFFERRPCSVLAHPEEEVKSIFVNGVSSAPFAPASALQLIDNEASFTCGMHVLKKLCPNVHFVTNENLPSEVLNIEGINYHTIEGPHPIDSPSVHIYCIDPIFHINDIRWTLNLWDVIAIGKLVAKQQYLTEKVISLAGEGVKEANRSYLKVRVGLSIKELTENVLEENVRLICGDPLTGAMVDANGFLGVSDFIVCALKNLKEKRTLLHFLRFGASRYSSSKTYLSGFLKHKQFSFSTHQHGEFRPFVDGSVYDKVMPIDVPTMPLVKAIMAQNYELAKELGLLEVDSKDFALPAFVCPSKIDLIGIVKQGLHEYAKQYL